MRRDSNLITAEYAFSAGRHNERRLINGLNHPCLQIISFCKSFSQTSVDNGLLKQSLTVFHPNFHTSHIIQTITNNNFHKIMGTFRKTWFCVTAVPLLCRTVPIATFGMIIYFGLNIFCGFGICWGQKIDEHIWRKMENIGREAGWS